MGFRREKYTEEELKDIMPYSDEEVNGVVSRLFTDQRFIAALKAIDFEIKPEFFRIESLEEVQELISIPIAKKTIREISNGFHVEDGIEHIADGKGYLIISNHSNIPDPMYICIAMSEVGLEIPYLAVGDNLFNDFTTPLLKLNKSIKVKRDKGTIELVRFYNAVWDLLENGKNVWIAQRGGRSKDGNYKTDPNILSLFCSPKKRKTSMQECMRRVVPFHLSYECVPDEETMARQHYMATKQGHYEKKEGEDEQSMIRGIIGYVGRVYLCPGKPLEEECNTAEEYAELIDEKLGNMSWIWPDNITAYSQIYQSKQHIRFIEDLRKIFGGVRKLPRVLIRAKQTKEQSSLMERLERYPEEIKDFVKLMYANPVANLPYAPSDK